MKNRLIITGVLSALAFAGIANASGLTGSGTLGVTAEIQGSINLLITTDASGVTLTGTASAASLDFGTVGSYGVTAPTNVTYPGNTKTALTISTPVDVEVDLANSASASFDLGAILTTTDSVNTWTFNGVGFTATAGLAVVSAGTYGTATPYNLAVSIPTSNHATSVSNTVTFTATAN
jgi:hypothetical protein